MRIALSRWWHIIWTSLIGLVIGVIPGAGASIASFVAYQQSRTFSKTPELYGTGHPEGLIAPESANNGVTSGTLVPLLVLGIPGGATAAIMLVVMQYHGVSFGPSLFQRSPEIGYGMFMAMAVAYLIMCFTILPLSRYMSRVTTIPTIYLAPMIISFTLVGGFVPREYMFDMYLALAFGVLGYIARRTGYHVAAILIGVILGPLLETYFLRALKKSDGDIMVLFSSTLGNILWVAWWLSLVLPILFGTGGAKSAARGGDPCLNETQARMGAGAQHPPPRAPRYRGRRAGRGAGRLCLCRPHEAAHGHLDHRRARPGQPRGGQPRGPARRMVPYPQGPRRGRPDDHQC